MNALNLASNLSSSIASICAIAFVLFASTNPFVSGQTALTAYEILRQYDFPPGLLPKGVTSFKLDRATGDFKVFFNQTCKFPIQSYELEYGTTVSGVISRGRLSNLEGVSVEVLFIWLSIVEVIHDGDELQFSVGIASANFPAQNFLVSPQCGCGINCNKLGSELSSS